MFVDQFQPAPEFEDSRWICVVEKPVLVDAVVAFAPYDPDFHKTSLGKQKPYLLDPSCPTARTADSQVPVVIYERSEAASDLRQNAWQFILENASAIEKSLVKKLMAIHTRSLTQFLEEEMPDVPEFQKHWEEISRVIPNPEESITSFFKLVGVSLATSGLDECGFVGFEFQSGWDQDHGLEILMHKDRVLVAAGMTELMSPGKSIVESVKATQKYESDPDDLIL